MAGEKTLSGFRFVEIHHGDTLQRIAVRELNDASKWALIAAINDLRPPYIVEPGSSAPKTRAYGQLLAVPAARPTVSAEIDPNRVFKVDLDLTTGDLRDDGQGDLLLIEGRNNFRQALRHRIMTPLRDLLFHPRYGCGVHSLKGAGNDRTANLLAAQYVKGALLSDSRCDTVPNTTAVVVGDRIEVTAQVKPVAGAAVDVSTEL